MLERQELPAEPTLVLEGVWFATAELDRTHPPSCEGA